MGGMTFDQKLKQGGIDARKNAEIGVPVGDLWYPAKDDPTYGSLAHPRQYDELDESLIADMIARFEVGRDPIEFPALVWNVGPGENGKLRLLVINGCRRDHHGVEVQKRLRAAGKLGKNDVIRIKIEQWQPPKNASNDEIFAALICERLKQNNDPFKKPDSPRVLADTIQSLRVLGKTDKEIQEHMPKGVGLREIAALAHYDDLHPDARAKFDNGAPVGLLPVVLEVPREKHVEKADELLATGATSTRGVTRKKNAAEKKAAGKPAIKMNAQRVSSLSDFVAAFHNGELEKKEEDPNYEIDTRYFFVTMALRAANGEADAIEKLREELMSNDAERVDFDRVLGKIKGTGRGRGRPRKNPDPVVEVGAPSEHVTVRELSDDDDDDNPESED